MVVVPRYSHHRHTGRLRPHHETSYGLLLFVLLLIGGGLLSWSLTAGAASTSGGGQYGITGVVTGPRPVKSVVITSPSNGQNFQANPITVEGTCQVATLVKVFKNGVLAGSAPCQANGRFSLQLDLLIGQNALTAVSYNANDLPGPDGAPVNVTLSAPAGGLGFSTELIIQSTNYYRGAQPGEKVVWPITLVGGQSPYAVNIDWGDGTSDLITRLAPGPFTLEHSYKKVGGYLGSFPLIIRASDAVGHTAYLQLTTIVNAPTGKAGSATAGSTTNISFVLLWPIWVVLFLMVISFWLGERREKKIMQRQMAALS